MVFTMIKHKVQQIIRKQGGNAQIVFRDGARVFWPKDCLRGLIVGTTIYEHKHKNGQTVAFSWDKKLRFVGGRPEHVDDAIEFVEKFKLFDRVPFNNAIVRAMDYFIEPLALPDTVKIAHNVVLLGVRDRYTNSR